MLKKRLLLVVAALLFSSAALADQEPRRITCIAPASPGGGFDLTCKFIQSAFKDSGLLQSAMPVTYMPGGIGAVAYNSIVGNRSAEPGTLVAFTSGSLLNLAQGKFGRHDETAVRWLAAVGANYGVLAVRADSPFENLQQLVEQLRDNPGNVPLGGSGTVGSQYWTQAALLARSAGITPRSMRYVSFEGGGDAYTALLGGHIQLLSTNIASILPQVEAGELRVLALLADEPQGGRLQGLPTAVEQGYDFSWPVIMGYYMGPKVTDEQYNWWAERFEQLVKTPAYQASLDQFSVYPLYIAGDELDQHIRDQVATYRQLAIEFGLAR